MKRGEVLEIFARQRGEAPAITGPSFGGRMLYAIDHRPATLYNMELGYSAAMFLGLALCLPDERVFVIEGDGSMLAGIGVLTTIARYRPRNLVILVIDNRAYVTTGSLPTPPLSARHPPGTALWTSVRSRTPLSERCFRRERPRPGRSRCTTDSHLRRDRLAQTTRP